MESVKKNFIYNIIYQILVIILPLITAPYIARTLGAEAVGIYSYTNSIAYYFLMIAMLGISNYGNRSVAASRDDKKSLNTVFSSIYLLQVCTFSMAILSYIIYIVFFAKSNKLIAFIQLLYVISGLFDISWLFFGLEKFKITVSRNIIIKILTILCMFAFVHKPEDLWLYTLIMSMGTLLSQIYLWFYVKKEVELVKVPLQSVVGIIKPILLLFIPVLAYSIYKVMDKIMLGNMSTYTQVGFYQNAEKIINIPMGVITALGTVMLPRMSNIIAKGEKEKTEQYIRISIKIVTILCSAIAFGLMGIASVLAPVYLGEAFSECSSIIMLLSISVFFIAWANVVRTQFLIPNKYDKIYVTSTLVGAVLNFFINYALIPRFQSNGAAIGTVVAEFSVMIFQVIAIRKELNILKYIAKYIPVICSGAVMMFLVHKIGEIMGNHILTLIVQICCGGIFFCSFTLLYLFFSKDEVFKIVAELFKGKIGKIHFAVKSDITKRK